jgi:hypothetical protein
MPTTSLPDGSDRPDSAGAGGRGRWHAPADPQDLRCAGQHPHAGRGGKPECVRRQRVCLYEALRQRLAAAVAIKA